MGMVVIITSDASWAMGLGEAVGVRPEGEGLEVQIMEPGGNLLAQLAIRPVDLIVADSEVDQRLTRAWVDSLRNVRPDAPILLLTRPGVALDPDPEAGICPMERPESADSLADELFGLLRKERKAFLSGTNVGHFVQLLSSDKKTCSVAVYANGNTGVLFFDKGELVEAVHGSISGSEAALDIFGWEEEPDIEVRRLYRPPPQTVEQSLSAIVMQATRDKLAKENAAAQQAATNEPPPTSADTGESMSSGVPQELINQLQSTKGVRSMAVVRRDGTLLAQSKGGQRFAAFFAYVAMEAERIRALMDWKGPRRMNVSFDSGWKIVVLGGEEMIAGLLVDPAAFSEESARDLAASMRGTIIH